MTEVISSAVDLIPSSEDVSDVVLCPGSVINIVMIVIILLIATIVGKNIIQATKNDGRTQMKIILALTGLYIFWMLWGSLWHRVTDNLCEKGFYGHSVFVSVSPLVFALMVGILGFIMMGIYELIKILVGKTWGDIILTSEFKDEVDGLNIRYEDQKIGVELMKTVEDLENSILNINIILKNCDSMIEVYKEVSKFEKKMSNEKLSEIEINKIRENIINKTNYLLGINNTNEISYETKIENETLRQISYKYDVFIDDILYANIGLERDQKLPKGTIVYLPNKQTLPSKVKDDLRFKDKILDYLENMNMEIKEVKVLLIKDIRVLNKFKDETNKDLKDLENKISIEKNKDEYKKALIYNDLYFERNFMIENILDNPYGVKLIGKDRNKNKQGLIIIEKKIPNGWSGVLKMMTINEKKSRNIDDFTLNEMFKFKENINKTYYYEIDFQSVYYVNKVIIKGKGEEQGIYLADNKTFVEKLLSGIFVVVIFLVIIGIFTGFIQGGMFNINNIYDEIVKSF